MTADKLSVVLIRVTVVVGEAQREAKEKLKENPSDEFAKGQLNVVERVLERIEELKP